MSVLTDAPPRHAARAPDGAAVIFEGAPVSFAEFEARTNAIAAAMAHHGVGPGERVAYLGRNTGAYFEVLYGAMKAGAVTVPINWRLAPPEVRAIVADAGARVVVFGREYADDPAYGDVAGGGLALAAEAGSARPMLSEWAAGFSGAAGAHAPAPGDIAVQLYTSGTTGLPKGVMLPHAAVAAALDAAATHDLGWNRWGAEDHALLAMPVAHVSGTGWGINAISQGAACHVLRQFDADAVFDAFAAHRITRLFLVPAALQILVRHDRARDADFSGLHEVCYGASPMPVALLRECMAVMRAPFVQFYGMTETSGTVVALPAADHAAALGAPEAAHRLRAAGRALPWAEIRAVAADGRDVPAGSVGEIVCRSAANMAGYWNRAEETARTIDAEGWLHTGDAGFIDEQGYIFIHDRVKDMIITGGENVYPTEVENALCEHPDVAEAAVIGVPDAKWGEAVQAFVVARAGAAPSEEALIAWCRGRIAGFKLPRGVAFVDGLPRNAAGKLLKRALRETYWGGRERQVN